MKWILVKGGSREKMLVNLDHVAIAEDEGLIIPGHGRLIVEEKLAEILSKIEAATLSKNPTI